MTGVDNINTYYDPSLKYSRLSMLGIGGDIPEGKEVKSGKNSGFSFIRMDLKEREAVSALFRNGKFDLVCHLAAQAGVRYSIENPHAYIDSNVVGFMNILEGCRSFPVRHLVYASSSSVYGLNETRPFRTSDKRRSSREPLCRHQESL